MNSYLKIAAAIVAMAIGSSSHANISQLDTPYENCLKQLDKEHGFKNRNAAYWHSPGPTSGRYTVRMNGQIWKAGAPVKTRGTCESTRSGRVLAMKVENGTFVDKRGRR